METIKLETSSKQYNVYVGSNILDRIAPFIEDELPACTKVFIITDETVKKLHLERLMGHIDQMEPIVHTVPSGEKAKTFQVYYECMSAALEHQLDRKSLVLAFGGGAVGDLAGFVAATFMRGIPFIQIPTTILAHDSAVGGKVAINHPEGKNMIGAFYQPEAVFYDLSFLTTLPLHEVRSGFAEVIKHALIHDEEFYQFLLHHIQSLENVSIAHLQSALMQGMNVKANIVKQDEKELGIRAFLNFGHTLGHAIEAEAGYGKITHGEAVLIGMLFALQMSQEKLGLSFSYDHFRKWVQQLGYETTIPSSLSADSLLARMQQDKKTIGQNIRFVLLNNIGQPSIHELDKDYLFKKLNQFLKRG